MIWLYIFTLLCLILSVIKDRGKTKKALILAYKKIVKILPSFILMIILVSIILYLVPNDLITLLLKNDNKLISLLFASLIGSVAFMPGFIVFPLAGILAKEGVDFMILSAFTTTLMMVGVVTLPIEKKYFGMKMSLLRNGISLVIALCVAFLTGLLFGEISL